MNSNHIICETEYSYKEVSSTTVASSTTTGCDLSVIGSTTGLVLGAFMFVLTLAYVINYFRFKN